jgi:hypothetical protein
MGRQPVRGISLGEVVYRFLKFLSSFLKTLIAPLGFMSCDRQWVSKRATNLGTYYIIDINSTMMIILIVSKIYLK